MYRESGVEYYPGSPQVTEGEVLKSAENGSGFVEAKRQSVLDAYSLKTDLSDKLSYILRLLGNNKSENRFAVVRSSDVDDNVSLLARQAEAKYSRDFYEDIEIDPSIDGDLDTFIQHELSEELGPYEDGSIFYLLIDKQNEEVAGSLRCVDGKKAPLKSLIDIQTVWSSDPEEAIKQHGISPLKTWDIAMAGIARNYRNHRIADSLYHFSTKDAVQEGIEHWTTIFVRPLYIDFRRRGAPFGPINGLGYQSHMGKISIPAIMKLSEIETYMSVKNPEHYKRLYLGECLDADYFTAQQLQASTIGEVALLSA